MDIEQGNKIDQSMVDQLRPNMTKRQVVYIMGSPMLTDSFHDKRWDYIYSSQPGGGDRIQKRVTLFFNGDNLVGVQGDLRPSSMPVALDKAKVKAVSTFPSEIWKNRCGIKSPVYSAMIRILPRMTIPIPPVTSDPGASAAKKPSAL